MNINYSMAEGPPLGIIFYLSDIYKDVWNVSVASERKANEHMLTLLPTWISIK